MARTVFYGAVFAQHEWGDDSDRRIINAREQSSKWVAREPDIRIQYTEILPASLSKGLIMISAKARRNDVSNDLYRVRKTVQGRRQRFLHIKRKNQFNVQIPTMLP